jgi:hypothetical protein
MIFISHRGNLTGREPANENTIVYIIKALMKGFDVEIDVSLFDGKLFLGHDSPQEEVPDVFLGDSRLWIHAKNAKAFAHLLAMRSDIGKGDLRVFWHDKDAYALTSHGDIWTCPGVEALENSIYVMPETIVPNLTTIEDRVFVHLVDCLIGASAGVCSDYVGVLKQHWEEAYLPSEREYVS